MLFSVVATYLVYALITAYTPGPNNIMALYAVSQQGWKRGRWVLLGIASGFLCVMLLCALFCYQLETYLPAATGVLKYVGAAYIVYLAIHVARSKPEETTGRESSFLSGFLLEFVNVKIILYAITIYTGYVLPRGAEPGAMVFHAVMLALIGMSGNLVWAAAGGLFQRLLTRYYRPFNYTMAALLLWCAAGLALGH